MVCLVYVVLFLCFVRGSSVGVVPRASDFVAWRAGADRDTCSGPCAGGHYCREGSVVAKQFECGNASVYCPPGSPSPALASPGQLTVGASEGARHAVVACPASL